MQPELLPGVNQGCRWDSADGAGQIQPTEVALRAGRCWGCFWRIIIGLNRRLFEVEAGRGADPVLIEVPVWKLMQS